MNYLSYSSTEMFSSTELIRKSKMVFDKLAKDEIEKAIILRDGKPSFMLLDFKKYEDIMNDYLRLKSLESSQTHTQNSVEKKEQIEKKEESSIDEIKESELEDVLAQIDQLEVTQTKESGQPLKEFWD